VDEQVKKEIGKWLFDRDTQAMHIFAPWYVAEATYISMADEILSSPALRAMMEDARKYHEALPLVKMMQEKADQWDALGYTSPYVMPEDYEQVKRDAEKWRRLMALFDTSCDKCFLGHVCGTHRKAEAVCEDIKEAMETNDER